MATLALGLQAFWNPAQEPRRRQVGPGYPLFLRENRASDYRPLAKRLHLRYPATR